MTNGKATKRTLAAVASLAAITLAAASATARSPEVPFTRVVIDQHPPERPWYKMVGDLNGDGYPDIAVGGARGPLVWYAQPGWKKTRIADGGWDGVNGEMGDVDGDGDTDIVMGGVVWFQNPGAGGGAWSMNRIDKRRAHDIELGDVNLDGRLDVAARDQSAFGKSGNAIHVYLQNSPNSWSHSELACPHGEGLKLSDIDRDGDPDILIGARWYENTRNAAGDRWRERQYTRAWTEPDAKVETADLNGDGRLDVVLTPAELKGQTYKIAWYEAPADPRQANWTEHVITPSIECVIHSLGAGDFDGDGNTDLAIAEMHQGADPDEVCILLNGGAGTAWSKQVLSTRGSHDIVVADIDKDGDLDIVGANHGGSFCPLELWRNDLKPPRKKAKAMSPRRRAKNSNGKKETTK